MMACVSKGEGTPPLFPEERMLMSPEIGISSGYKVPIENITFSVASALHFW